MAIINYFKKEINVKIIYCGPGLSGKTSNLQWLNQNLGDVKVGKLISLATQTDRTLFFDLMAVALGKIQGFDTRIQLFTTPGQVFYNSTRKLVLKGVDGIVFVADSQEPMKAANIESLNNLKENLVEYGLNLEEIPLVFQFNKRDLNNLLSVEELQKDLNTYGAPYTETSAIQGQGIEETFRIITKITFTKLKQIHEIGVSKPAPPAQSPPPAPKIPQSPPPEPPKAVESPSFQTPTEVKPSPPQELKILKCLQPLVERDGTVSIPILFVHPKDNQEYRMTLQLKLIPD